MRKIGNQTAFTGLLPIDFLLSNFAQKVKKLNNANFVNWRLARVRNRVTIQGVNDRQSDFRNLDGYLFRFKGMENTVFKLERFRFRRMMMLESN